jgi:hypothetical protein
VVLIKAVGKLVYHSEPFEKDTEVSGFFKFTAWELVRLRAGLESDIRGADVLRSSTQTYTDRA